MTSVVTMPSEIVFAFFALITLVIVMQLMAGSFDGSRVEKHVRDMGSKLIDKSWSPFGPGWFGEKNSRIYEIIYKGSVGRAHRAHVRTSMISGVYLTNDRVIEEAPKLSTEDEKAALKKRLAELEEQHPSS
jgi:hypothetical protein